MRRIFAAFIFVISLFCCNRAAAQYAEDGLSQELVKTVDGMLNEYFAALEAETIEIKIGECDYMIANTADSLIRQYVALRLYDHFLSSKVMGDEAVAVHIVDEWLASGIVAMKSEYDLINAKIYADFHRNCLLGNDAPILELQTKYGEIESLPCKGRISVLFFYDIGCRKCQMETARLRDMLCSRDVPMDFYAVYVGDNEQAWRGYSESDLVFNSDNINVHHLWDPDFTSDFQKQYGVLQTPRMFLVAPSGELIGTGLDTEALAKLLGYAEILLEMYNRAPVGGFMPRMKVPATLIKAHKSSEGVFRLDRFRGKPGYIVFHTEGCRRCEQIISELEPVVESGLARLLLINVDQIVADDRSLAKELFDSFDLSVLPLLIEIDGKKRIVRKSNSLYDE